MLKSLKNKFLTCLAALIFLASCGFIKKDSPSIYISNASSGAIHDLKIRWNGVGVLDCPTLNPGDTKHMSLRIANDEEFFGEISASWNNEEGDSRGRSFTLAKTNLPSIGQKSYYPYVQLYFDQYDFEVMTSDSVDLSGKTRKMDHMLANYRDAFARGKKITQNSTEIKLETIKDTSVPTWLGINYGN